MNVPCSPLLYCEVSNMGETERIFYKILTTIGVYMTVSTRIHLRLREAKPCCKKDDIMKYSSSSLCSKAEYIKIWSKHPCQCLPGFNVVVVVAWLVVSSCPASVGTAASCVVNPDDVVSSAVVMIIAGVVSATTSDKIIDSASMHDIL